MTTTIDGIKYVTATEAAVLVGWQRDSFTSAVSRGRAPQPALTIADRKLYKLTEIRKWRKQTPRRARAAK
jgi:hypothetical protein